MTTLVREIPADVRLKRGGHESLDQGMCVMELASYIAGESWTDHPDCTCPIIGAFLRAWNDTLPTDADRNRLLLPLVTKVVGTRSTPEVEQVRGLLAADWFIREFTPAWLSLVPSLGSYATILRDAKPLQSWDDVRAIQEELSAAESAARSAAWSAARSAAWSAAWSAAESAAWSAAESAAWSAAESAAWSAAWSAAESAAESAARSAAWSAAESAARSAAWSAARSAARSAAESAAWSALSPTTERLQQSAVALVDRMIAVK